MESSVKSMIRRSSNIEHSPHDLDDVYSKRRRGLRLGVGLWIHKQQSTEVATYDLINPPMYNPVYVIRVVYRCTCLCVTAAYKNINPLCVIQCTSVVQEVSRCTCPRVNMLNKI